MSLHKEGVEEPFACSFAWVDVAANGSTHRKWAVLRASAYKARTKESVGTAPYLLSYHTPTH